MNRDAFIEQVGILRQRGTSIRSIASQLGAHPSKVQRAVAKLSRRLPDAPSHDAFYGRESVFVGREREMVILRQALHDAMSGSGRLVLLAGEPGIGKTRLAGEFSLYAKSQHTQVYWGRCHEEPPTPSLWPWIQIVREYVHRHRVSRLRSEMGPGSADIANIVPEVRQKLTDVEPALPLSDPPEERFRLFDSMSSFFRNSSRRQPTLIILDNLQWCDKASLLLLEFLAKELAASRMLVVGVHRNLGLAREHPLSSTLGELSRQPSFPQLTLRGLSQNEVAQLIRTQTAIEPFPGLVEALYGRTEGNPLFLIHIIKSLAEDDGLIRQAKGQSLTLVDRVPDSLQGVIGRNLEHLSPQCHKVMTTASVLGRQFTIMQIQRIIGDMSEEGLQDLLKEAVRAGVVTKSTQEPGYYQFAHALVQDTLSGGLPAAQRVNLHTRIGQVLEDIYGDDAVANAAQLAHHFTTSSDLAGSNKAIRYSRLAAERALAMFAYEEAALYFQRALEIKQKQTPAVLHGIPDDETAEILFGIARAEAGMLSYGGPHKPAETIGQLLDYYIGKKDIAHILELAKFPMFISDNVSVTESRARFERVLSLVDPGSREAGWLLCIYGYFLGTFGGDEDGAQDALDRALVIARRYGDQNIEMRALINSVQVRAMYWKVDWDRVLPAIDMAQRLGDPQVEVSGLVLASMFATTTRGLAEAQELWKRAMSAADRLRYRSWRDNITALAQWIARYQGNFEAARAHSERAVRGPQRNIISLMLRALTEYELGELEEGDRFVHQAVEDLNHVPAGAFFEYGWCAAQLPFVDYLTAREKWFDAADRVVGVALRTAPQDMAYGLLARMGMALRAINSGDIATARQWYDFLKGAFKAAHSRCMIPPIAMSSDRLLGLLCLTFGDVNQAVTHFEEAREICRAGGYLPQLAWSCYDYARAMQQRKQSGDRKMATALAAEALSVADKLGMKLLAGRVRSMRESRVSPRAAPDNPYHLSGREVEVLKLLARGKTNREIALQLNISYNTATTHVRNILSKGNLANRAEAAAFAARHYHTEE